MLIKTRIFDLHDSEYNTLSELAQAMGISVRHIYQVKESKRKINQKFIVGALKAFPEYKLNELFYLTPDIPTVTDKKQHRLAKHSAQGDPTKGNSP